MKQEVLKNKLARARNKGFMAGAACALGNFNEAYDQPTMCLEILGAFGSYDDFRKAGVDEYDKKRLRKIIKAG